MDRFGDIVTLTPAFPPAIPVNAIHDALAHPLGTPRLREMASGKKRVVCLLEDASRPARTAGVVEAVLEELDAAPPAPPHIEVVFAYGAHIGLEEASIFRKLPAGFCLPVHHHDARAKLAKIGQTAGGTPIHLHPAVVEADLRVGIGTTNFHPAARVLWWRQASTSGRGRPGYNLHSSFPAACQPRSENMRLAQGNQQRNRPSRAGFPRGHVGAPRRRPGRNKGGSPQTLRRGRAV